MKLIIAGSRGIGDEVTQVRLKEFFLLQSFIVDEIVSGTARGVDQSGEAYAKANTIAVKRFPADWNTYGRRAGFLRNAEMAAYADALLAIWDGYSSGTRHMINCMKELNKPVWVYKITPRGVNKSYEAIT